MNNIPLVFWLIPIASVVALGMAWFFFRSMMKEEEGTDRMKEIAEHVRKGAMAYLKQQYNGRIVLRTGRLLWHENRHLRFGTYCQRSANGA